MAPYSVEKIEVIFALPTENTVIIFYLKDQNNQISLEVGSPRKVFDY